MLIHSEQTSPWSRGTCARFGAGRSGVRLSAGSYQDLVNWYCSLLIRRTVCGRAAGNTLRTQNRSERNETEIAHTQSWRYKTLVVIKCQQRTTITNKQTFRRLSVGLELLFRECWVLVTGSLLAASHISLLPCFVSVKCYVFQQGCLLDIHFVAFVELCLLCLVLGS